MFLKLPFVKKADLDILKNEDQISIRIGNYRREMFLTSAVALLGVKRTKFEANELRITFMRPATESQD